MYFDAELDCNSEAKSDDSFISEYATAQVAQEFGHGHLWITILVTCFH